MFNEKFLPRTIGAIAGAVILAASLGAMAQASANDRGISETPGSVPNAREFGNEVSPSGDRQIDGSYNERDSRQFDRIHTRTPEQRKKQLDQQLQQAQTDGSYMYDGYYVPGVDAQLQK